MTAAQIFGPSSRSWGTMPTLYRLTFADELVYEVEFVNTEVPDAWIRGVVYRVHGEQRDPEPMQHADGRPMEFHGPTEHATMALACAVLQSVLERHIGSITKRETTDVPPVPFATT